MKAFISSLITNYLAERDAAARAATALRYEVLRAEDFGARPDTPQQACLQAVREADVMILILGARYGAPQPSGFSATHEEWREAVRMHRPVLVFVETVSDREPAQQAFVDEVQAWEGGRVRDSFSSPDELRDKVTRALADLGHHGPADEGDLLDRAIAAVPKDERGTLGGEAQIAFAVAGGPRQQVLRPAELEAPSLARELQRDAMFDADAPLDQQAATTVRIVSNQLSIAQQHAYVIVREDGTVVVVGPASDSGEWRSGGIPSIVEERLRDRLAATCRFTYSVLERIDDAHRLTDVVPVAALLGAAHRPWRTAAEVAANPGSAAMSVAHHDGQPVVLSPAMMRRAGLYHNSMVVAEDLVVLLRRQRR